LTSYTPSGGSAISLTYGYAGNSACERSEQTSREPGGRVPSWPVVFGQAGCNAEGGHNLTQDGDSALAACRLAADHKYTWDYRNRLYRGLPTSGSLEFGGDRQTRISAGRKPRRGDTWNTTAEYKYDGVNRRVRKVVTNKGDLNGTTRFLWGGTSNWQCLEERDGSDDLMARYTYAPGYIDAAAMQERDLNADDDFGDDDEVVYYLSNTLYSVYALVDADENVIERYRYDAYGACTVLDADGSADADGLSDVDNPYTFTGRRLDTETGLMQYRNRYYSPTFGRFVSRDPAGYDDWPSLYYAAFVPLALDPLGTMWVVNQVTHNRGFYDPQTRVERSTVFVPGEDECGNDTCTVYSVTHRNTYQLSRMFQVEHMQWYEQSAVDAIAKGVGIACIFQTGNALTYCYPPWALGTTLVGAASWLVEVFVEDYYPTDRYDLRFTPIPDTERETLLTSEEIGRTPVGSFEGECP